MVSEHSTGGFEPKTIKLVFATSPTNTDYCGVKANTI